MGLIFDTTEIISWERNHVDIDSALAVKRHVRLQPIRGRGIVRGHFAPEGIERSRVPRDHYLAAFLGPTISQWVIKPCG